MRSDAVAAGNTGQGGDMVEPPFAAPSEVASERDVLLATKLHMPRPRPDLVPRPRLAERLDEGLARGLMLVCAPAGYGKTVLLADWARRGRQPVAWLSLDVGDNDPARFWRHGVAALDQVRPGLAERVGPLLGALVLTSVSEVLSTQLVSLAELVNGLIVILVVLFMPRGLAEVIRTRQFSLRHFARNLREYRV